MTRRTAADYRRWSTSQWCNHVRGLNVSSLTAWANRSRSSYGAAVTLGVQRNVARALGWLPKLEKDEMYRMSDDAFAERFRARRAESISDMWRIAQHYCEYLRSKGRLETVAALLGISYAVEFHPPILDHYLDRCRRAGDFKAWCQLDPNAAAAARKHGLMEQVKALVPQRPRRGYWTVGGYCRSLPELAVARLLEANQIPFTTGLAYPFTYPRGRRHQVRSDFYLPREGAYVEVWMVEPEETSSHWRDYLTRRQFKTQTCRHLNLRLIEVEGRLLFRAGPEVYLDHARAVFDKFGVTLGNGLDLRSALGSDRTLQERDNGLCSRREITLAQ